MGSNRIRNSYNAERQYRGVVMQQGRVLLEAVWLELWTHEVSAVEDEELCDPALGGPDTGQRLRIMQRIHRAPLPGQPDRDGCRALEKVLRREELDLDERTMRLTSAARLQVVP